jgi:hypothetical protein
VKRAYIGKLVAKSVVCFNKLLLQGAYMEFLLKILPTKWAEWLTGYGLMKFCGCLFTTPAVVSTNLPPSIQGYYDKVAMIRAQQTCVHAELCEKRTLPEGEGTTVTFWRYVPLTQDVSVLTEADDGGKPPSGFVAPTHQEISVIPADYGNGMKFSYLSSLQTIDQGIEEKLSLSVQQGVESIDMILKTKFATGLLRRRADGDTNFQVTGTLTTGTSTTTLVDSSRTAADAAKPGIGDSYYNGGYLMITSGVAAGFTSQISAYTNSSGTFTVAALPIAPGTGATYRVVVGTNINSSAVINSKVIRQANLDLDNTMTTRFDSWFKCVLDPNVYYDFFDDPIFVKTSEIKESLDGLETNQVGEFAGVKFFKSTTLYRETVAGVASTSGVVHVIPIVGKQCLGMVSLGPTAKGKKNLQTWVRTWEQLGQERPHYNTISWGSLFGSVVLNGLFGVALLCGASDQLN